MNSKRRPVKRGHVQRRARMVHTDIRHKRKKTRAARKKESLEDQK